MAKPRIADRRIALIILSLFLILNLVLIAKEVGSFGWGILRDVDQNGLWRSARFAYSGNFADYILFLRNEIPEDSLVVIPPKNVSTWYLGDTPTMQFFLEPREITNCLTIECGSALMDREDTYVLVMGRDRFPGPEVRSEPDRLRMHNDTWGVYGDFPGQETTDHQQKTGFSWVVKEVLFFLLISVVIGLLIWCSGTVFIPDLSTGIQLSFGIGIMLGYYSIGTYLILLTGWLTDLSVIFYILTLIAILVILFRIWRMQLSLKAIFPIHLTRENIDWGTLILICLGGLFSYLSIGSGFHETDSIVLWGAKAVGILRDGLAGVVNHGTNTTFYPLHIPLLISTFLDLFGFLLPGAKVIFPLYYLALIFLVYGFLRDQIGWVNSLLSALVLATIPIISRHAMIAYANLPLTYYLVAGVVFFKIAHEDLDQNGCKTISGLFFSLAAWTRPEGIWLVITVMAALLATLRMERKKGLIKRTWMVISPPLLFYGVWVLTRRTFYTIPAPVESTIAVLFREIASKSYHLNDLTLIVDYLLKGLIDFRVWGIIGTSIVISALFLIFKKKAVFQSWDLFTSAAVIVLLITGMYYVLAFDQSADIYWWVTSGYFRMLMPGMVLAWLGVALIINSPAKEEEEGEQ